MKQITLTLAINVADEALLRRIAAERYLPAWGETIEAAWAGEDDGTDGVSLGRAVYEALIASNADPAQIVDLGIEVAQSRWAESEVPD